MTAVYDVSIAYKNCCPSFLDNAFGVDPSEVHIHVRRIQIRNIPTSDSDAAAWLIDTFQLKDQLLSNFKAQGHFPNQIAEEELSFEKCLLNFMLVISLTAIFFYLTFFSSFYFKIYAGLACIYLASATHLKFQPMPVLGFVRTLLSFQKPIRE